MRLFNISRAGYTPKIRIINLVDILLVLLLFLFVTTTFRMESPAAVKVSLPEAKTAEQLGKEKVDHILLTVGADETIYLGTEPIQVKQLETALRQAKEKNPDVVLQFSADKKVSYGRVVAIVDAARAAGIQNLTAFTEKSVK